MMTEIGRVVAQEAHAFWVETVRNTACGDCSGRDHCGQGIISKMYGEMRHRVRVQCRGPNDAVPAIGQRVEIELPERVFVLGVLAMYLVPLVALIAGALAGAEIPGGGDATAAIGAVCGLVLSFWLVRKLSARSGWVRYFEPRLLRVLEDPPKPATADGPTVPAAEL